MVYQSLVVRLDYVVCVLHSLNCSVLVVPSGRQDPPLDPLCMCGRYSLLQRLTWQSPNLEPFGCQLLGQSRITHTCDRSRCLLLPYRGHDKVRTYPCHVLVECHVDKRLAVRRGLSGCTAQLMQALGWCVCGTDGVCLVSPRWWRVGVGCLPWRGLLYVPSCTAEMLLGSLLPSCQRQEPCKRNTRGVCPEPEIEVTGLTSRCRCGCPPP